MQRGGNETSPAVNRRPPTGRGIVAGPVDVDARRRSPPRTDLRRGLVVEHRASGMAGAVLSWAKGQVVILDRHQAKHRFPLEEGGFMLEGRITTLVVPAAPAAAAGASYTASGSVVAPRAPARVARASRLWVEGRHDAELLEKVWGDDLRHEGVVVELLDGVDHLEAQLDRFGPGPDARVGVLVDHLVRGSKESRVAESVRRPHVLVRGHRYVDVWAAIRPGLVGLDSWPEVDRSQPWKDGICAALGVAQPWAFWQQLLGQVRTYADLDPSLVGAVEELIDFVTETPANGEP